MHQSIHAMLQSSAVPPDRPILSPPSKFDCRSEMTEAPTKQNTMTEEGEGDCCDS